MRNREEFITGAKIALSIGLSRDDIYHETMQYAAKNALDRYALWNDIVSGVR